MDLEQDCLARDALNRAAGCPQAPPPDPSLNIHSDLHMLLFEFQREAWSLDQVECELPQLAHVRFGRRGHSNTELLHTVLEIRPVTHQIVYPRHQSSVSCRFGRRQRFLLSECADGVGVLHEYLRVSLVSIVLPERATRMMRLRTCSNDLFFISRAAIPVLLGKKSRRTFPCTTVLVFLF